MFGYFGETADRISGWFSVFMLIRLFTKPSRALMICFVYGYHGQHVNSLLIQLYADLGTSMEGKGGPWGGRERTGLRKLRDAEWFGSSGCLTTANSVQITTNNCFHSLIWEVNLFTYVS